MKRKLKKITNFVHKLVHKFKSYIKKNIMFLAFMTIFISKMMLSRYLHKMRPTTIVMFVTKSTISVTDQSDIFCWVRGRGKACNIYYFNNYSTFCK